MHWETLHEKGSWTEAVQGLSLGVHLCSAGVLFLRVPLCLCTCVDTHSLSHQTRIY